MRSTTAPSQDFTHLHLHSQYSLLDGAIRLDELIPAIKERGMSSVAVNDHGNMFGAVHFYKTAKRQGVKPIIGCEAYVAGKSRHDRQSRDSAHLVLLAKDNAGYKNLSYLVSMGYMEGFYYNPRIDRELLKKYSKGIIGLSACLGGVVNKCLLKEGIGAAAAVAKEYAELFEPGHFYLELQSNGFPEQERANAALMEIGATYNIPLVATADSHYLRPEDSKAHEILMCIGQGRSLDEFRAKMGHSDLLYACTPQQMWEALGKMSWRRCAKNLCRARSTQAADADALFVQIEKFAGYAFNKSHSAAYAVITYQTAFLKTYYPLEFMAALLSTEMRDQDNVVRCIASARDHKISILPPCVNRSGRDFSVERTDAYPDGAILFGLGAVKGIGDAAIDAIIEGRVPSLTAAAKGSNGG